MDSADDTTAAPAPFGDSVGFLLSQLGYETAHRFGQLMREVELEPRQFALMRAISASGGGSQNAVADRLRIPRSSMVSVIDQLEDRGLVERRANPADRRTHDLHLSDLGQRTLARATELAMGLEAVVSQDFDEAQRAELIRQLQQVAGNLGLVRGLHPDTSTGHGSPHWTESDPREGRPDGAPATV